MPRCSEPDQANPGLVKFFYCYLFTAKGGFFARLRINGKNFVIAFDEGERFLISWVSCECWRKLWGFFWAFYWAGSYDVTFSLRKGFCFVQHKTLSSSRTSVVGRCVVEEFHSCLSLKGSIWHFGLSIFMLLLQKLVLHNQYLNYFVTK